MKPGLFLAAGLTAAGLFAVCLSGADAAAAGTVSETSRTITARDGRFRVTVPASYENAAGLLDPEGKADEAFLIEAADPDAERYLIFNDEELDGVSLTSFDDYFTVLAMGVTSSALFADVQILGAEDCVLAASAFPARKLFFTAFYSPSSGAEPVRIAGFLYAVRESGTRCAQFFCWAKADDEDAAKAEFDAIVNTLEESAGEGVSSIFDTVFS